MTPWSLPKARPISCNDCPNFQRLHISVLCIAESFTRLPCVINTTFSEKIYSRWCCIDRLSWRALSVTGFCWIPIFRHPSAVFSSRIFIYRGYDQPRHLSILQSSFSRPFAALFRELNLARADGSLGPLLKRLNRIDVLVIDDWAMAPLAESERRDFWEIAEDRYQTRSMILTSQLPVSRWHEQIGDPTLADGILDRLVHNAHRIEMRGESMRKKRGGGA